MIPSFVPVYRLFSLKDKILSSAFMLSVFVVAACSSSGESQTLSGHTSPPPPVEAESSMIRDVADILGVGESEASGSAVNLQHQPGGTDQAVVLQDPAGSGEYRFEPGDLVFSVGETVNFTLTSESEFHTFTIDALYVDMATDAGESLEFSFTFETAGTYSLVCVPHEASGMVTTITVN